MRRREFITLLGGAVVAWPLAARAQQHEKLPIIGYLGATTAAAEKSRTDAFVQRLGELGWIEGHTVAIESRWGDGRAERYAARSSSRPLENRSAAAWSLLSRDQVETLPACQTWEAISPPNAWKSCARFSQNCVSWPS